MDVKELHVGNWVENNSNKPFQIKASTLYAGYEVMNKWSIEINPIPLTEERAKALGFIKDGNGNWWRDFGTHYLELIFTDTGVYPVLSQIPELSSEPEQSITLQNIHSVHELQNLVFWTMNEELDYEK